jgi:GntR family transcriptional repressor for pyruvate dehydrogenase complex
MGATVSRRPRRRISPAEAIADELRSRILSGAVPDGGELPKLEALIDEFGASKVIVRQACHILETEGLVRVRRGNVGGSEVHVPTAANAAYVVGQVLEVKAVRTGDVAIAVGRFEPLAAELGAERKDRMRTLLPALGRAQVDLRSSIDSADGEGAALAARRWHEALVEHCGNETISTLLGTLEAVWSTHAAAAAAELAAQGQSMDRRLSERVHAEHEEIQRLIAAGDGAGAAAAARAHLRTARIHRSRSRDDRPVRATTVRDELFGWGAQ